MGGMGTAAGCDGAGSRSGRGCGCAFRTPGNGSFGQGGADGADGTDGAMLGPLALLFALAALLLASVVEGNIYCNRSTDCE